MNLSFQPLRKYQVLRINSIKVNLFVLERPRRRLSNMLNHFFCTHGQFLGKYLAVPVHYWHLKNAEWKHVEEFLEKHLNIWNENLLSFRGRLVLINHVIANM